MIRQHISGALLAIAVVIGFALLTEDQPIVAYSRDYATLDVCAGDVVDVEAVVMRDKACTSHVKREWIDPQGNILVTVDQDYPDIVPAGEETYRAQIVIPPTAIAGPLRQRVKTTFYCNFAQRLLKIGSDFILPDVIFNVKP